MAFEKTILVVAIDFGTSGSGYAFSFRHEFVSNPLNISTYQWTGCSYKTPTSILIKPDKTFDSFGDEAEEKYKDLCLQENQGKDWYFMTRFKMQLYKAVEGGEDIRKDLVLKDVNGKRISGKLVFSFAIRYLQRHVMDQLNERNTCVPEKYISWVITVPAIWTDACKQFMRESAEEAGVMMENFSLVYEPEAASIFVKSLPLDRIVGDDNRFALQTFETGRKFIIIDGGGGTVDISAQTVSPTGELNVIHRACGGPYGGESINQEYRKLLVRICGGDVLREFKEKHIHDYTDMMQSFEMKKRVCVEGNVAVRLPVSLCDILSETTGCEFLDLVADGSLKGSLKVKRDKLFINAKTFQSFFDESLKCIQDGIRTVLDNPQCSSISTIILVGGLSESEVIRCNIRNSFPDKEIFIPQEGGLAVLKGAVIYGHNPRIVNCRTCNYTYGVAVMVPFLQGIHDPEKLVVINGEELCDDIFHPIYTINEQVEIGEKRTISLTYHYENADEDDKRKEENAVEIFVSDNTNPTYVTDEGTMLYAIVYVPPPGGLWPPVSQGVLELEIGGTEIIGTYIDRTTGNRTTTKCGFLPTKYSNRKRLYDPEQSDIVTDI